MATELPRPEHPLTATERGKVAGEFQNWVFDQLDRLPTVKEQLFARFKGPNFNVSGNDGVFVIGRHKVAVRQNVDGNRYVDDTSSAACRQMVLEIRPLVETFDLRDYFTIFSTCDYQGNPSTNTVDAYRDGELNYYPDSMTGKTLLTDPRGVVDIAKQALTNVFAGSTLNEPPQGTPVR